MDRNKYVYCPGKLRYVPYEDNKIETTKWDTIYSFYLWTGLLQTLRGYILLTTSGGLSKECDVFYAGLASLISDKIWEFESCAVYARDMQHTLDIRTSETTFYLAAIEYTIKVTVMGIAASNKLYIFQHFSSVIRCCASTIVILYSHTQLQHQCY